MKKSLLIIFTFMLGLQLFAQKPLKQGEISYLETMKLNFSFEGMTDEMRERMPKERKAKKVLFFNEEESSYQMSKEQAEEHIPGQGRGRGMRFMQSSPDDKVYLSFTDNIKIEQKEFMTRIFLITGEPVKDNWKLTGKQEMILEYPCMQAEQITEQDTILAWFSPSIPVPAGPGDYVNLPGLVLKVDINNGQRIIIAEKIDLKELDKTLIEKPKKGKKVTREEFQSIREEKMKEMGGEGQGRNVIIMRGGHH